MKAFDGAYFLMWCEQMAGHTGTNSQNQTLSAIRQKTGKKTEHSKMFSHAVKIRQTVNLPNAGRSRKVWLSVETRELSDCLDTHTSKCS